MWYPPHAYCSRHTMMFRPSFAFVATALLACSGTSVAPLDASAPTDAASSDAQTATDVAPADGVGDAATDVPVTEPRRVRVATFNASLFRAESGELATDLADGQDSQARQVAEVLQRVRPDVVLINEFDWDADGAAARTFAEAYLQVSQNGAAALDLAHWFVPETNTGLHSGVDLDQSGDAVAEPGSQAYGNDAYGFGQFHGQYGMAVFSRFPLGEARTFQTLRWAEMPGNLLPTEWYSDEAAAAMRLSSKNHIDLAVDVDGHALHVLASHPTPPSFDGAEDRNGRRNHDEIRFWRDYVSGGDDAAYIRDDAGVTGGASINAFVILGDLNSDPADGDSRREALNALLSHPRVQDPSPQSAGARIAAESDGGANASHVGDAALDTADFSDGRVGNLRVDYALPSANLTVVDAGVFWPGPDEPFAELADVSDHHLVWVDVTVGAEP